MKGNVLFWIVGGVIALSFAKFLFTGWKVSFGPPPPAPPPPSTNLAPTKVTLVATDHVWTRRDLVEPHFAALRSEGFVDAGTFRVEPLGVIVRLFVHAADRIAANVYEHSTGSWLELVSRYEDGTTFTIVDRAATASPELPGHRVLHLAGASASELVSRMRLERPAGALLVENVDTAVGLFEEGFEALATLRGSHLPSAPAGGQAPIRISIKFGK